MPLSYDLTTFQILGQNLSNFCVGILVQTLTPKGHFEINWPLIVGPELPKLHTDKKKGITYMKVWWGLDRTIRGRCSHSSLRFRQKESTKNAMIISFRSKDYLFWSSIGKINLKAKILSMKAICRWVGGGGSSTPFHLLIIQLHFKLFRRFTLSSTYVQELL